MILIDLTQQTQITCSDSCLSLWERCPEGAERAFSLSVTAFGRASSPKGRAKRIQVDKHFYYNALRLILRARLPNPNPIAEINAPTNSSSNAGRFILENSFRIIFAVLNVAYSASMCITPKANGENHFHLPRWLLLAINTDTTSVAAGRIIHRNTKL